MVIHSLSLEPRILTDLTDFTEGFLSEGQKANLCCPQNPLKSAVPTKNKQKTFIKNKIKKYLQEPQNPRTLLTKYYHTSSSYPAKKLPSGTSLRSNKALHPHGPSFYRPGFGRDGRKWKTPASAPLRFSSR
jgi:hypothetical protein